MTYGSRGFKNGKSVGYLIFDTGKKIFLNAKEKQEFDHKLREAEYTGKLKAELNRR